VPPSVVRSTYVLVSSLLLILLFYAWQPLPGVGNVNCQGGVNSIDALLVLQLGAHLLNSLPCIQNADVNHNGEANSIDAVLILQYTAGLLAHWPP